MIMWFWLRNTKAKDAMMAIMVDLNKAYDKVSMLNIIEVTRRLGVAKQPGAQPGFQTSCRSTRIHSEPNLGSNPTSGPPFTFWIMTLKSYLWRISFI